MDIEQIKSLVELMVENDLSRIELREGDTHVLLRRGQPIVAGGAVTPAYPTSLPAMAGSSAAPVMPATESTHGSGESNETFIRSPMVGTFYSAPDPESPPFIKVGDTVSADSVVCIVEAMKVFNEIKAEVSGRISRVLVRNAEAVEYDQPLFAVVPV